MSKIEHKPGDVVRIVGVGKSVIPAILPYVGLEAIVRERTPDGLYMIEVDLARGLDRGGQLGPRFFANDDMLIPEITERMLEAGDRIVEEHRDRNPSMDIFGESEIKAIYRAMRAARFER